MSDVSHWERRFVSAYIIASKRDRYLNFLKGSKHRQKILERLNHSLDYDRSQARKLEPEYQVADSLVQLLRDHHAADTCYLMADGNRLDRTQLRLEPAARELLQNHWGALIICPRRSRLATPIVVYKEEEVGDLILFDDSSAL